MKISLRKEKQHCQLLQAYSNSSDSGLMDYREDLDRELKAVAVEVSANIFVTSKLRGKHRMALRRLYERNDMLTSCERMSIVNVPSDANENCDTHSFYIGFADETLQLINDLLADGETVFEFERGSHALRLPLNGGVATRSQYNERS